MAKRYRPRVFHARFPDGTSMTRADPNRVFTHAYLVLFERPEGTDGFQRAFCQSWEDADARVEAEKLWLRKHRHTLIEAFIVEADELKQVIRRKPSR
jgi:hypothetical protein